MSLSAELCAPVEDTHGKYNDCRAKHCTDYANGGADQVHELQSLQQFAVSVFQPVSFIDHHAAPVQLPQLRTVGHDHLEGGDQPMELQDAWDGVTLWVTVTLLYGGHV